MPEYLRGQWEVLQSNVDNTFTGRPWVVIGTDGNIYYAIPSATPQTETAARYKYDVEADTWTKDQSSAQITGYVVIDDTEDPEPIYTQFNHPNPASAKMTGDGRGKIIFYGGTAAGFDPQGATHVVGYDPVSNVWTEETHWDVSLSAEGFRSNWFKQYVSGETPFGLLVTPRQHNAGPGDAYQTLAMIHRTAPPVSFTNFPFASPYTTVAGDRTPLRVASGAHFQYSPSDDKLWEYDAGAWLDRGMHPDFSEATHGAGNMQAFVRGNDIHLIGGETFEFSNYIKDWWWVWDSVAEEWGYGPSTLRIPRGGMTLAYDELNDVLYLGGGYTTNYSSTAAAWERWAFAGAPGVPVPYVVGGATAQSGSHVLEPLAETAQGAAGVRRMRFLG